MLAKITAKNRKGFFAQCNNPSAISFKMPNNIMSDLLVTLFGIHQKHAWRNSFRSDITVLRSFLQLYTGALDDRDNGDTCGSFLEEE